MVAAAFLLLLLLTTTAVFVNDESEVSVFDAIQIQALESQIDEKTSEVKGKDELVAEKEKLGDEIATSAIQIKILNNFLEQKNKEKESAEAWTNEVEKKLAELNSSIDKLQKTNEEQKKKIGKLERAIKTAKEHQKWAAPHVENNFKTKYIPAVMKRYKTIIICTEFLKFAITFHNQVQAYVEWRLKSYELTKDFATKEIVWFGASVLLGLPIFAIYTQFCRCTKTQPDVVPSSPWVWLIPFSIIAPYVVLLLYVDSPKPKFRDVPPT